MNDESDQRGSRWRERVIAAMRKRLTWLEIETHRMKAKVARLESDNEFEIADQLANELVTRRDLALDTPVLATGRGDEIFGNSSRQHLSPADGDTIAASSLASERRRRHPLTSSREAPSRATSPIAKATKPIKEPQPKHRRRANSAAWIVSLSIHAAAIAVIAPMTFVMLTNERLPLFTSMFAQEAPDNDEIGLAPVELVSFEQSELADDTIVEETVAATTIAENLPNEFASLDNSLGGEPALATGQLDLMPTDVGSLMSGGIGGDGPNRGVNSPRGAAADEARLGTTSFFGTPAQANCIVFLVDNSGSMKQGRMETTLFELARSVESLSEKQRFYVVFYSDQAYPMLYPNSVMEPLAATQENKNRLFAWLQTVELCTGGALLKALAIAESLHPEVVYILSDGDITGTATMQRLTQVNARKFAIHTLGMGVNKPQDAQNLLAIAQANRGTFRMVQAMPAAIQMAKTRPLRSNSFGVGWGQAAGGIR